jgi:signal transduction histidine kinase
MMRKKISFIKLIRLWGVVFLTALAGVIVGIDLVTTYHDQNIRVDKMRTDYVEEQKQKSKREVERVVTMINYERTQSEILTRKKIKSRVYEAYTIAQNIYEQNKALKRDAEIQKLIVDALRPIRFENESGYYFATRLDGVSVLFADRPQMEGSNMLDMPDTRGRSVLKDLIEIAKESGEGFYEYYWTKPESTGNDFKKLSFIKRFEPYEWFIGTGLYVDDVEEQIKATWMERINNIRFGKNLVGYLFANDWKGKSLAHGAQPNLINKELWEYEDSRGNKTTQLLIAESKKKDGGFSNFWWRKPDTGKESPKIVYSKGIPEWELFVGSGVYIDDIEQGVTTLQAALNAQTKTKVLIFIIIVVIAFALFFILFNLLSNRLKKDLNLFISFFDQAAFSDKKIDREIVQFVELDQMAESANKMLKDKINAQQDLLDEREQLEQMVEERTKELKDAQEQLVRREKLAILGQLAGGVGHELRNPLGVISNAVYYLKMVMPEADESIKEYLETISEEVNRSTGIVSDLLDFSRVKSVEREEVTVSGLVSEVLEKQPALENVKVATTIPSDLPPVFIDHRQIGQVLDNLFTNACQAMPEGGKLSIQAKAKKDKVHVSVMDTGSGISKENMEKVFEPLFTTKTRGIGLGLAVSKNLMEANGGSIEVESEEGKGSIFTVIIPTKKVAT